MTQKGRFYKNRAIELIGLATLVLFFGTTLEVQAQKELPEVRVLVSVPNLAFSAIWVAEQLNFFERRRGQCHHSCGRWRISLRVCCGGAIRRVLRHFLRGHDPSPTTRSTSDRNPGPLPEQYFRCDGPSRDRRSIWAEPGKPFGGSVESINTVRNDRGYQPWSCIPSNHEVSC